MIAAVTSWLSTHQANRFALQQKKNDAAENGAFLAHKAFVKLLQLGNSVFSIEGTIDNQFNNASAEGNEALLPVQKVQEITGLETVFETFETEEIAFLLHGSDAELLGDLLVFEKRVISINEALREYNQRRSELTDILETGIVKADGGSGTVMSAELQGKDAVLVNLRVGALNGMIGTLIERIDRETQDAGVLLDRFSVAAKMEFGDLFPSLRLEASKRK